MQQKNFSQRQRTRVMPKLKNDAITWLLKIGLFCGIFFSIYNSVAPSFNAFFAYLIEPTYGMLNSQFMGSFMHLITDSINNGALSAAIKIISPIAGAAVLFFLYQAYAGMFARLVNGQYAIFKERFDLRKFRICLDSSFIFLTVAKGAINTLFVFNPLLQNLGGAFSGVAIALIAFAIFLTSFTRGMSKKFYAVNFYLSVVPLVAVLICV